MNASSLAVVLLTCASTLLQPAPPKSQPPSAGTGLSARVDKLFSVVDPKTSPGCAVAVIDNGRIVHKAGYRLADLDHDVPIAPSTIFQVGSLSKQFTATAILLLPALGGAARVVLKDKGAPVNTFARMSEAPLTPEAMRELTGEFRSDEIDQCYRISIENGKLYLRRFHAAPAVLDPLRADLFQVGGGRVTMEFVRNADRQVTGFLLSTTRVRNMVFRR
jgi:hypothetical protein